MQSIVPEYMQILASALRYLLFQKIRFQMQSKMGKLTIFTNVLQLPEGGDFEALYCQPSRNFDRSTKLDLNLNRHFWVGAVSHCLIYSSSHP
jgi:hypothetical protein